MLAKQKANFHRRLWDWCGKKAYVIDTDRVLECIHVATNVCRWSHYSYTDSDEWRNENLYDFEYGVMKGSIILDSTIDSEYKICFIDDIDEIDLSSTLNLQDMYKSLLLTGLTYRLAIRYKLNDWVSVFKEDFEEQKSLIKRINSSNRPIVWSNMEGSFLEDYYN